MQKSFLHLLLLLACFLLFACEQKKPAKAPKNIKDVRGFAIPDTIFSDNYGYALNQADKSCLADSLGMICEFGLSAIAMLGSPLDELMIEDVFQVTDTLFTQGGYQWRAKELNLNDGGQIVLEGNFVDEGDPAGRLPQSTVNRIRITAPSFQTAQGVQVGQNFAELKAKLDKGAMVAIYIPTEKIVDVTLPESSGIRYNFEVELAIEAQEGFFGKEINAESIPDSVRIQSIVVAF